MAAFLLPAQKKSSCICAYNDANQYPFSQIMLTTTKGANMDGGLSIAGFIAAIGKAFGAIGMTATSFGIGAALASVVVMCMTLPKTAKEWAVGIISTVVGSLGGGAVAIIKLGLLVEAKSVIDAAAIIGVAFACGLPAWLVVRVTFNWLDKQKDKTLIDVVREAKEVI